MRNVFTIANIMIKNMTLTTGNKRKVVRASKPILSNFLITLFFTAMMVLMSAVTPITTPEQYSQVLASTLFSNTVSVSLVFSASYIFSAFFLNSDDSYYLHFPISSSTIFSARFISGFLLGCIIPLSCPLSYYIIHIIKFGQLTVNAFTFINPLLMFIAIEFIMSSIVFLLGLFLSEVCHLRKHRQVMSLIQFAIILIGAVAYGLSASSESVSIYVMDLIQPIITSIDGSGNVLLSLYILLGSIVLLIGIFFLARYTYLKTLLGANESKKKKKKSMDPEQAYALSFNKYTKSQSQFKAYLFDDLKTVFRSGTYIFQVFFPTVFIGFIILITGVTSFLSIKYDPSFIGYMSGLIFAIMVQAIHFSNVYPTVAYTKCRQSFIGLSVLPVDQKKLFMAKLTPSIIINVFFSLIFAVIYLSIYPYSIGPSIIYCVASILSSFGVAYVSQLFDLFFGTTNAPNELAAVKNNKSNIIGSLFVFGVTVALVLISLIVLTGIDQYIPALITLVVSAGVALIPLMFTYNKIPYYVSKFVFRSNN